MVAAAPELPIAVLGAARRQLDVPRSADIIYKVCPDVPSGPVRSESCWNSSQGTPGCALTCALKNRAYGASVPAGGVCLQGQFYGTSMLNRSLFIVKLPPRTSCANEEGILGGAGSNPRPIRSDRDRPPTCISDRNAVPMVAMGPFRSPLRPGWVTGSARLSGGCAAHARSSGARRVAELRPLRRTGRLSPAHNFAKANLHADQRDVDAPSGPNVRFFLSAARA